MRRIVIDNARREGRGKRGGARDARRTRTMRCGCRPRAGVDVVDALALDRALQKLERLDPDQGRMSSCAFSAG